MQNEKDFLDELIDESSKVDPEFRQKYEHYKLVRLLAERRVSAKLSQAEVASRMKLSASRVAEIEAGANVSIERFLLYSEVIGASIEINFSSLPSPDVSLKCGRPISSTRLKQANSVA